MIYILFIDNPYVIVYFNNEIFILKFSKFIENNYLSEITPFEHNLNSKTLSSLEKIIMCYVRF